MRRVTFEQRAAHMAETLARRGITDQRVLAAMATVPREAFVPAHLQASAYDDRPLPIGEGQTISQPWVVAKMIQALELSPTSRVLDVGTGSGYAAAVLSRVAGRVWSIERRTSLATTAKRTIEQLGYEVEVIVGDGTLGFPGGAPFDGIIVGAAAPEVSPALVDQVARGGRLVLPVGDFRHSQRLLRLTRSTDGRLATETLATVAFVPLVPGTESEH